MSNLFHLVKYLLLCPVLSGVYTACSSLPARRLPMTRFSWLEECNSKRWGVAFNKRWAGGVKINQHVKKQEKGADIRIPSRYHQKNYPYCIGTSPYKMIALYYVYMPHKVAIPDYGKVFWARVMGLQSHPLRWCVTDPNETRSASFGRTHLDGLS